MAHAETCPVCKGSGILPWDGHSSSGIGDACHGCGGIGWVTVQDTVQQPCVTPWPVTPKPYNGSGIEYLHAHQG